MKYISILISLLIFILGVISIQVYTLLFLIFIWVLVLLFCSFLKRKKILFYVNTILWSISVFFLIIFIRLFFFEIFLIPTASMQDAVMPDERVFINKTGFPLNGKVKKSEIPWINIFLSDKKKEEEINLKSNIFFDDNKGKIDRNDIVVFRHPYSNKRYIKRCVGLPGDTLKYNKKGFFINNERVIDSINFVIRIRYSDREKIDSFLNKLSNDDKVIVHNHTMREVVLSLKNTEIFDSVSFAEIKQIKPEFPKIVNLAGTSNTVIPDKHYFVIGDNFSNSSDSRDWGFLPEENIKGKAKAILFSDRFSENIRRIK